MEIRDAHPPARQLYAHLLEFTLSDHARLHDRSLAPRLQEVRSFLLFDRVSNTILKFVYRVGGILFSSLFSDSMSVGASTSIFGLIGFNLAWFILQWSQISQQRKIQFGMFIFFTLMMNLTMLQDTQIDKLGHMGGLISGLSLGMLF